MGAHKKLMEVRKRLHAMGLKKTGWNAFSKYDYFELSDFLVPALGILYEVGLCSTVSFTKEYATLRITDVDDGSVIDFTSPMGGAELKGTHEVQQIGAVQSYMRRYLYVAALEIVEHDAIDSAPPAEDNPYAEMDKAENLNALQAVFAAAYRAADQKEQPKLKAAYDTRKAELSAETKE